MNASAKRDLDATDRQLIALLRRDARQPAGALARAVGLSRSTVQDRIKRLKQTGVIKRFTIDTTGPTPASGVRAFLLVRIDGRPCSRLIPTLAGLPEVESCDHVAGPVDVVLTVRTASFDELSALRERMVAQPGVATVTVAAVMKTHVQAA